MYVLKQSYNENHGFNIIQYDGNVVQDKQGFIWIGSDNGLFRFDGKNFKSFKHKSGDSTSLPDNSPVSIFIDSYDRLWMSNKRGFGKFHLNNYKFSKFKSINKEVDLNTSHVRNFYEDKEGDLWVSIFYSGLALVDTIKNDLKIYRFYDDTVYAKKWQSTSNISNITEDKKGIFWISTNHGLVRFDKQTGKYKVYRINTGNKENDTRNNLFTYVFVDEDESIWATTWGGGLKKFNAQNESWETYKWDLERNELSTYNIGQSIAAKSKDELWLATLDKGVIVFNKLNKKFSRIRDIQQHEKNDKPSTYLFTDKDKNLWYSGYGNLGFIQYAENPFRYYELIERDGTAPTNIVSTFLVIEPQTIFTGTVYGKGFYEFNTETQIATHYPLPKKTANLTDIYHLQANAEKNIWLCTNEGLYLFDPRSKKFVSYWTTVKNKELMNSSIYSMIETHKEYWYASYHHGILYYKKGEHVIELIDGSKPEADANLISNIHRDKNNVIWLGDRGGKGIGFIDASKKITWLNKNQFKIPHGVVSDIASDNAGNIYFAFADLGVGILSNPLTNKSSFKLYTEFDGLPGNRFFSLAKDSSGKIWLSANKGLAKFDPSKAGFIVYNASDGLLNDNSESSLYVDAKGYLYRGYYGPSGLQVFHADSISAKADHSFTINLHKIRIAGKELESNLSAINTIRLNSGEDFSFDYNALTFYRNDKIEYAYQLQGLDKDWRFAATQRSGGYVPPPGKYTLLIKARYADGEWCEPYKLSVIVDPSFWETTWFTLLLILAGTALIAGFMFFRIKQVRKEEQHKTYINQLKAEAEMQSLRSQMNPHFIFNCMNTIDAYVHKNKADKASAFLNKFSKLLRMVLENSQHDLVSIRKDIAALELYIELECERSDFAFDFSVLVDESVADYKIPPLLIQPFVENAIMHGLRHKEDGRGKLVVSVRDKQHTVECRVEDNGIGRAAAVAYKRTTHQSMGMDITRNRLSLLGVNDNGEPYIKIIDKKDDETGTTVYFNIPKLTGTVHDKSHYH